MNEIICPNCKKAFKVDEAGFASILKQVRDDQFNEELKTRLALADTEKQNAIQIAERAGELYDKIVNFLESLNEVGEFIKKAEQSHTKALKQLATGKGNAMKKAQELKEMGANTAKSIPTKYLSEEENNTLTNSENQ